MDRYGDGGVSETLKKKYAGRKEAAVSATRGDSFSRIHSRISFATS
ncbi:MAG: hypothetical protein J7L11_04030 [Thermoprotei archaeon]|nr:hypothetical protein [Thermoprotei archaeon]